MAHRHIAGLSMEDRLSVLGEQIRRNARDNTLIFLDTGAIIDFEQQGRVWRARDRESLSSFYYALMGSGFPVFVNRRVYAETKRHATENFLNGRHEISPETMAFVHLMYKNFHKFLRQFVDRNDQPIDEVRYDVYWASQLALGQDPRSNGLDRISRTDKSLVAAAVWSRYAHLPGAVGMRDIDGGEGGKKQDTVPIDGTIIISPDGHVREIVDLLTDRSAVSYDLQSDCGIKFGYDGIRVVSSR